MKNFPTPPSKKASTPPHQSLSAERKFPQAILFDLDDTLVSSRALWSRAEERMCQMLGGSWSGELQARCQGRSASSVADLLIDEFAASDSRDSMRLGFRRLLLDAFCEGPIHPTPGAEAACRVLADRYPLAVASGSPLPIIQFVLKQLGLEDCFSAVVSSEDLPRSKPSPDVFLAAAEALGVAPEYCVVVEDSAPGIAAARAAGMPCIVLCLERPAPQEVRSGVNHVVGDLCEIPPLLLSMNP